MPSWKTPVGSWLHGTNTKDSDRDILTILHEDFFDKVIDLPVHLRYLLNNHGLQSNNTREFRYDG